MTMKFGNVDVPEYPCAYIGCDNSVLDDARTCPKCDREFCANHSDPNAHECGNAMSLKPEIMASDR